MTSARVAAVLERVRRCCRPVVRWDAAGVWLLTRELGLTMSPTKVGDLRVNGDRSAVLFLAVALRRHKAALLSGACTVCRYNLATSPNGRCPACAVLQPRTYVYTPCSVAERAYLEALERSHPNEPRVRNAA